MKTDSTLHTAHTHGKADYMGIAGSVLCLIHCLATPALALGSSFFAHNHEAGHGVGFNFDYIFILVNGLAVHFAAREHKLPLLRLFLWGSWLLFSVSLLLEKSHPFFQIMGYVGSGLLIAGHGYNLIYCRPWRVVNE